MPLGHAVPKQLQLLRALVREHGTNPYQIAKAAGLNVTTVQRLLTGEPSPSLRNIEAIFAAFGLEVRVAKAGELTVKPGTGRGHGRSAGKRREKS